MTKPRQGAERAKVEGGEVSLIGRMWWNLVVVTCCDWVLLVCLLVWDRPTVQNQRRKPKGWAPHFVEQGRWPVVMKPRQGAERAKVEGGKVSLIGRMCACWCGTGLLYKIKGTSPRVEPLHFIE